MADLPSPRTWTTGDKVTADALNQEIRDGFAFMMNPPMAHVSTNIAQGNHWDRGLGPEAGWGARLINWNIRDIDTDAMWSSGANTRLTARTAGWYEITLHIDWQVYNAGVSGNGGNRFASIQKNNNGGRRMGTAAEIGFDQTYILGDNVGDVPQTNHLVVHHFLNAGDYVEAVVMNTVGVDLGVFRAGAAHTSYFAARWIASQ